MFNLIQFNLICALVALSIEFALAAKAVPLETDSVKVLYVIDSIDDEKVEVIMPRSVLDSIFQDVDSVYLASYGACLCDCFGDDQLFFSFYDKSQFHGKFYGSKGLPQICNQLTSSLDLVFKLKNARKINALANSLSKKRKPHPKKRRKSINIESIGEVIKREQENGVNVDSLIEDDMRRFDSLLKSGKSIYEIEGF